MQHLQQTQELNKSFFCLMRLGYFFRHFFSNHEKRLTKIEFFVFGLGNPGKEYFFTRHNIGFRIIDQFISDLENPVKIRRRYAEVLKGTLKNGMTVAAVKPVTYMNRSGLAVADLIGNFKSGKVSKKFLIIVDDIHLPFGTFRIRLKGSHGGHNGLKSIIDSIGSDFPRLRVGIGPLPDNSNLIDFVLGKFTEFEIAKIDELLIKGQEIINLCAAENLDAVMNKYN